MYQLTTYFRLFSEISLAVIGECAFGLKFNDLDAEDSEFVRHATNLLGTPEDDAALTSYFMLLPCKKKKSQHLLL